MQQSSSPDRFDKILDMVKLHLLSKDSFAFPGTLIAGGLATTGEQPAYAQVLYYLAKVLGRTVADPSEPSLAFKIISPACLFLGLAMVVFILVAPLLIPS